MTAIAGRPRTVLALARVEAILLARSPLMVAGLLAAGVVVWLQVRTAEPFWWHATWQIGFGQLAIAMAVLVAAQLAAGRARRDCMADLYASFPVTSGTRTVAHLTSLAGAVPASLLLIGAAAAVLQSWAAIGTPSVTVLAGGVLLVIAAGAAGIAIATRFAHPLAGVLGALALLLSSGTSHTASAGGIWLLPWAGLQDQLGSLPGPLAGYPPAGAHVLELAGFAILAAAVALAVTVSRGWARRGLAVSGIAAAGVAAVAMLTLAGVLQLRPIPTANVNRLVTEITDPAAAQRCASVSQVRYCLYPGFGPLLPSLEAPVNGVLAHLPARPGQPLTVRQVLSPFLLDPTITHGYPARQVSAWQARMGRAPDNHAAASVIYLPVGSWPAAGGQVADARFDVALAAAEWALRIPPTAIGSFNSEAPYLQCVPAGQAREAIAIWLAILATRPSDAELQGGLNGPVGADSVAVRQTLVRIWTYPGENAGYLGPSESAPTTAAGYVLARAMSSLPEQKVSDVLAASWASWLNWRTSDSQLAAALGIAMPSVPAVPAATPGPGQSGPGIPANPLCTS